MKEFISEKFHDHLSGSFTPAEIKNLIRIYWEDKGQALTPKSPQSLDQVEYDISLILKGTPIQYVTGKSFFYDRIFQVNEHVLIPRPETEELVSIILKDHHEKATYHDLSILDIGTGSGCIPIILKSRLNVAIIHTIEVSYEAVLVAMKNALMYDLEINFHHTDFLDEKSWKDLPNTDIIVSNPPYIQESERKIMSDSVLNYEPESALFPRGIDPLIFYRKIALFASNKLKEDGKVYVEINEYLALETVEVFESRGFGVQLIEDLQGKPRIIIASTNT